MVHLHVEVVVVMGAPREIVFEALANELDDWSVGKYIVSHKITNREGNTIDREMVRKVWGVTVRYRQRDELTPPSKIVTLGEGGNVKFTNIGQFESEPNGGTRLVFELDAELKGRICTSVRPIRQTSFSQRRGEGR